MFPDVWVQGEISNVNCHSSGHCYFSIKDAGAQLSAVMFRDDFRRLRFSPGDRAACRSSGKADPLSAAGRFQMVATQMEPQGKGGLQLAFEQLEKRSSKRKACLIRAQKADPRSAAMDRQLSPPPMAPHCMTC